MSPFFGDVFVTLCVFAFALIIRSRSSGSRLWFLLAFKKFLLVLRARPVFPAVIGFSWPSRSPLQVGSILGVFYPEPLFRYDVFVVFSCHLCLSCFLSLRLQAFMFLALAIFVLDPLGSGCFYSLVVLGRLKKFLLVLRVRPVFPAAIGFSWPSRSPYAGWLIFGVIFIPGLPLLRCLVRIFSASFTHVLPRAFFVCLL